MHTSHTPTSGGESSNINREGQSPVSHALCLQSRFYCKKRGTPGKMKSYKYNFLHGNIVRKDAFILSTCKKHQQINFPTYIRFESNTRTRGVVEKTTEGLSSQVRSAVELTE